MNLPVVLNTSMTDREAIQDALARFCMGMDTNDVELFDSAFTPDAYWDLSGKKVSGLAAIHKECYYHNIVKLDTTHMVSNVRIALDANTKTAQMSCLYVAWHWPGGTGMHPDSHRFTTGGQYYFDLVKDGTDGMWRIKLFRMKKQWSEGDIAVMGHKNPKDVEMLKDELAATKPMDQLTLRGNAVDVK